MKYEYQHIVLNRTGAFTPDLRFDEANQLLNHLGSQGWELVTVYEVTHHHGGIKSAVYVMKRVVGQ
jgi:hypothetical protein